MATGVVIAFRSRPATNISFLGTVLVANSDPSKQTPIDGAEITAWSGSVKGKSKSDATGFFRLVLNPVVRPDRPINVEIERDGYQPLIETKPAREEIWIFRLTPVADTSGAQSETPRVVISDVRLQYSGKTTTTVNVGSLGKTFDVRNTNDVPCGNRPPCSPDGRWKASIGSVLLDSGEGNALSDLRVSCIAGPCAFTRVQPPEWSQSGRMVKVSALGWSSASTFLVEAQVVRSSPMVMVRQSYPVILGRMMNFSLPANAEGPSIQAFLNKTEIVFPLGPDLKLSWAVCTVKVDSDHSKLIRCELKPGYKFQSSGA